MPNQRSKDKVYLGGFIDRQLQEQLLRQAKKAGMENNKFGFASQMIREGLAARKGAKPAVPKKKVAAPAPSRAKTKTAAARKARKS